VFQYVVYKTQTYFEKNFIYADIGTLSTYK